MAWTQQQLKVVLRKHESWLMQQSGVNAVGIGLDESGGCRLEISVDSLQEDVRQRIKQTLEPAPVRFVTAGPFDALKS